MPNQPDANLPDPPGDDRPDDNNDPRFTRGLVLEVVKVLQAYGYDEPVTAGQVVELQLHLWYFLHGDPGSRCFGGVR
jgi:hypothetical protein